MNSPYDNLNDSFLKIYRQYLDNKSDDFKDLNEVGRYLENNILFITLVQIDLTYFNSKEDYDTGTSIKEKIIAFLKNDESVGIISIKVISSKIFLFTKKKINEQFKINLDNSIETILESNGYPNKDNRNKKILYIIDKIAGSKDNEISIIPMYNDFIILFSNASLIEEKLSKIRNYSYNLFNTSNNNSEISNDKVSELQNLIGEIENSFDEKGNNNEISFIRNLLTTNSLESIKKKIKYSNFLKKSLQYYIDSKNYQNKDYLKLAKIEIYKYLIWIKMQKILLESFKVEKVCQFLPKEGESRSISIEDVKINQNLEKWYDSTMGILFSYLSNDEKKKANKLLLAIKTSNFNTFAIEYHDFFKSLNLRGIFNIPLDNLQPSQIAIDFLKTQMYMNFGTNYKYVFNEWLKISNLKTGYFCLIEPPKRFLKSSFLMNLNYIQKYIENNFNNNKQNKLIEIKTHLSFLEIDNFNALNTYYFPNDNDDYIYKKILDEIFKVAGEFLNKENEYNNDKSYDIFKTLCISAMGDEFFFMFLSYGDITNKEKDNIQNFLIKIKKGIIEICDKIYFPLTEKKSLSTTRGPSEFRILNRENYNSNEFIQSKIGKIGVSGVIKFNQIISIKKGLISRINKNIFHNYLSEIKDKSFNNLFDDFKEKDFLDMENAMMIVLKILDSNLIAVKKSNKGNLFIINDKNNLESIFG